MTQALYKADFDASSFSDKSPAIVGMPPAPDKKSASRITIRFVIQSSWLGWMLVAATPKGICSIAFDDTPEALTLQLKARYPKAEFRENDPTLSVWVEQVLAFVAMPQQRLDVPLDSQGTAFQQQVWQALQTIPTGRTVSYTEIAHQIGQPKAARAVARACASNQLAVAIPCHRVVSSTGALSGYRWGCDRKRALLEREASQQASTTSAIGFTTHGSVE